MFRNKVFTVAVTLAAVSAFFAGVELRSSAQQTTTPSPVSPTLTPTPTPTATPVIEEEEEIIKVETETVNVLFTAQNRDGRLNISLKPEDVRILENGQPQAITAFSRQIDLPLSLAIVIDTSISQQRTLPEEKGAAISFVESVVRPAKDEVSVVSFTGESTLEQGMTNNVQRIRRAIDRVQFVPPAGYIGGGVTAPGTPPISGDNQVTAGSTAIWDSIWITSAEVLGPAPERTRRAIILLTDGYNTSGTKNLDDAVNAALKVEAVIYTIGIGDDFYGGVVKSPLNKLSEKTGGRAYYPRDEKELREAFKQIQEELRSQYLLAYEPSNPAKDGTYRKIEIQFANQELAKQKVRLTHRQGYFAKSEKKK